MSRTETAVDRLVEGYLQGRLDAESVAQLDTLVRDSTEVRRRLVLEAGLDTELARLPAVAPRPAAAAPPVRAPRRKRRRQPPHVPVPLGLAAALLAGLFLGARFLPLPSLGQGMAARITRVEGTVHGSAPGSLPRPLEPGDALMAGDRVETGADGLATVAFADGTRIFLAGGTSFTVVSRLPRKVIEVWRGEIYADVVPQPAGREMTVHTPKAVLRVVGTRFALVAGAADAEVRVDEGAVQVLDVDRDTRRLVRAGSSVRCGAPPAGTRTARVFVWRLVAASPAAGGDAADVVHARARGFPGYRDDKALFQERFAGGLDAWARVALRPGAPPAPLAANDLRVMTAEVARGASRNAAAVVRTDPGASGPAALLSAQAFRPPFCLSFECRAMTEEARIDPFALAFRSADGTAVDATPPPAPLAVSSASLWTGFRVECVPGAEPDTVEARAFRALEPVAQAVFRAADARILLAAAAGELLFDNVVVRSLQPIEHNPRPERP